MLIPSLKKPRWFPQSRDEAGRFFFRLMVGSLGAILLIEIIVSILEAFNYLFMTLFFFQIRIFQCILLILCLLSLSLTIVFSRKFLPKILGVVLLSWCVLESKFLLIDSVLFVMAIGSCTSAHWLASYPNPFYSNVLGREQALLYAREGKHAEYIVAIQKPFSLPETVFVQEQCSCDPLERDRYPTN